MNIFDKILVCAFLLVIMIWQSLHQSHLFKHNKTISHFWKGIVYACAVALVTLPYIMIYDWWYALKMPLIGLLERLALFDFILNIIRAKPLFYNGRHSTSSKMDQKENIFTEKVIYFLKGAYVVWFILILILIK